MGVKLYAMTCGRLTGALANLMEGGEGEVILPIPAYLIEHPKGSVLFDSGAIPPAVPVPASASGSSSTTIPATRSARGSRRSAAIRLTSTC